MSDYDEEVLNTKSHKFTGELSINTQRPYNEENKIIAMKIILTLQALVS